MRNALFGKTIENLRRNGNIKLVTNDRRGNDLVSEPTYKASKWFSEKLKNKLKLQNQPT